MNSNSTPPWRHFLHVYTHVTQLRAERNAVYAVVFDDVVFLKVQVVRVLRRVKRRDVDVFVLHVVGQVSDGCVRVGARAVHGRRRFLLVDHFNEPVHELQDGAVPALEKIAAVNVEPRINDALVEAVVLAASRPEIVVAPRAFKIPRLN